MRTLACVWMVGCVLAACSSDETQPGAQSDADGIAAPLAASYCRQLVSCCDPSALEKKFADADQPVTDEAGCEAEMGSVFGFGEASIQFSIEQGRVSFSQEALTDCLAALDAMSCVEFTTSVLALCPGVLQGLVAEGGACGQDFDCEGDAYCDTSGENDVCKPRPALGEPCTQQCAEGLYCQKAGDETLCVEQDDDGAPCNYGTTCKSGACVEGTCGTHDECTAGTLSAGCGPCSPPG